MSKKTYIRLALVDVVIPNKEDIEITRVIAIDNFGNTHETEVDFFVHLEDEDGNEMVDEEIQKTKMIHAELKNGGHHRYLWLGNDAFAKLYESWDFDSDEGKFRGLTAFDSNFCYTIDFGDLKIAHDLIGQEDFGDNDTTIIGVALGNINWEISDEA